MPALEEGFADKGAVVEIHEVEEYLLFFHAFVMPVRHQFAE